MGRGRLVRTVKDERVMYLRYGIPRAFRGLRTNWRANVNTILILSASLSVLGIMVLLYLNVIHFSEIWFSNTEVSLFLEPNLPGARRDVLLAQVRQHRLVKSAHLVSPAEGLRALEETLGTERGALMDAGTEGLPYTIDFQILVDHRGKIGQLAEGFGNLPGVEEVVYTERVLEKVRLFFLILKWVGGFLIGMIVLSFFLIISHATKLSLHARRDEIEILNLVGATSRFIRSSFIVEGFFISLVGGLVAVGMVYGCHQALTIALSWNESTAVFTEETIFFRMRDLWPALAGAAVLGALSSYFAVNQLLMNFEK